MDPNNPCESCRIMLILFIIFIVVVILAIVFFVSYVRQTVDNVTKEISNFLPRSLSEIGNSSVSQSFSNIRNEIKNDIETELRSRSGSTYDAIKNEIGHLASSIIGNKESFAPTRNATAEEVKEFIQDQVDDRSYWTFKQLDQRRPTEWTAECDAYQNT